MCIKCWERTGRMTFLFATSHAYFPQCGLLSLETNLNLLHWVAISSLFRNHMHHIKCSIKRCNLERFCCISFATIPMLGTIVLPGEGSGFSEHLCQFESITKPAKVQWSVKLQEPLLKDLSRLAFVVGLFDFFWKFHACVSEVHMHRFTLTLCGCSPQGAGGVLREWKHLQGEAEAFLH